MKNKFFSHLNRWTSMLLLLLMISVPAAQGLGISTIPTVIITGVQPSTFDPTTGAQSTIFYNISGVPGNVNIDICDGQSCSNATIIRHLLINSAQDIGTHPASWDGKKDASLGGGYAANKTYLIRVMASNQSGTSIDTNFVTVQSGGNPDQAPVISLVSGVPTTTTDTTPDVTFFSTKSGNIIYGGDCFSNVLVAGGNTNTTVTFNSLSFGFHNNCTIKVKDVAGNISNTLFIPSFTIVNNVDNTPPFLAVVSAVPSITTDATPNFTFSSSESGQISYQGDCSSNTTNAIAGNNTITFNFLPLGFHNNCFIFVTDVAGNKSIGLPVPGFSIVNNNQDNTPPVLSVVTPVPNPTNNNTPNFTFSSSEAGSISYEGDCSSNNHSAIAGNNFITFNPLNIGFHNNCVIFVTDAAGNISQPLFVPGFQVTNNIGNNPPVLSVVTPVPNPTNDVTPNFTFSSSEAGTIVYGGDCFSNTTNAVAGNNTVTFNTLAVGFHNNCFIAVTDAAGNTSQPLIVPGFQITGNVDNNPPVLSVVIPVPNPTSNLTPSFTFSSSKAGTIMYGGDCFSNSTNAVAGNNTVVFNTLSIGTHNNCTVRVQDAVGNMSNPLAVPSFSITSNQGLAPAISGDYASPNPFDPNTQSTTISYTLSTTADVTVRIWSNNSVIETILSGVSQNAGPHQVSWDGKNGSNPYGEGTYMYQITANNNFGQDSHMGSVTISYNNQNGTAPNITNDYASPSTFNPYNESTKIYYTLNTSANLTIRIRQGNSIIETLTSNYSQNAGSYSIPWYGKNNSNNPYSEGNYTYEIVATNNYGQDTQTGNININYSGTNNNNGAPNITSDYVNPSSFNPNNELARVYLTIDRSAYLTVQIRQGAQVIRTLADNIYEAGGTYNFGWNGLDRFGNLVTDGTYNYYIVATNNYGSDTSTGNIQVNRSGNINNNPSDNVGTLISNVQLSTNIFDPSRNETARLCFDVKQYGVNIILTVLDGNNVVRTLTDRQLDTQSNYCATWNGRDQNNNIVSDAIYRFRLSATKGSYTGETAYRNVEVNTDGYVIGGNTNGSCDGFTDVPQNSPYCNALTELKQRGIISGNPDGTFRPYDPINRAALVKVVLLAFGKSIDSNNGSNLGFSDVDTGAWYMPYLRTAVRLGIIRGYPDSTVRPNNNINNAEFAKVFLETSGINVPYCNTSPAVDVPVSTDTRWYLDYACFMIHNNLMPLDSAGRFNPAGYATRGDIAETFYRYFMNQNSNYNYNYNNNYNTYNYNGYNNGYYGPYYNYNNSNGYSDASSF